MLQTSVKTTEEAVLVPMCRSTRFYMCRRIISFNLRAVSKRADGGEQHSKKYLLTILESPGVP